MFPFEEAGCVEDIRGRGCSIGVDHAVRRDDRGLGGADSPALTARAWERRGGQTGGPDGKTGMPGRV